MAKQREVEKQFHGRAKNENYYDAMEKAKAFLMMTGALSNWKNEYDKECDYTCAFFDLNA